MAATAGRPTIVFSRESTLRLEWTNCEHEFPTPLNAAAVSRTDVLFAGSVPAGAPEAAQAACKRAATSYGNYVQHLASCPLDYTYKGVVFMYCARPQAMLNHFIRAVRPSLTAEAAAIANDLFLDALAAAWECDPSEFSRDDPGKWGSRGRQAQLALRDGGGAFAALEHTRPAAFFGSFANCLPSLLLIPGTPEAPVLTLLRHPDLWSQPALQQLQP